MAITIDIKRTDFYNELSEEKQKEYFDIKYKKFLPAIDNIYYTVFLKDDLDGNKKLSILLSDLADKKKIVQINYEPIDFYNDLLLERYGYKLYKYCLSNPDLYDIFIIDYLPNTVTPRVCVQIRAFGLWTHSVDEMLIRSFNDVKNIFSSYVEDTYPTIDAEPYKCEISHCRENRIDFCYHTNAITAPEKTFSDKNLASTLHTSFKLYSQVGRVLKEDDGLTTLKRDYVSFGNRSSNLVFCRIYNKTLEVVQQGYKSFFFKLWFDNGLINFYDKYCYEYAFKEKRYESIYKARLQFYIDYGADERVKTEFSAILNSKNSSVEDFKKACKGFMPSNTIIMNIEYETKRKFYYYSDEFIDTLLKYKKRENGEDVLHRLYRIIDNRSLFLDYLTSETLCFKRNEEYCDWWERLRNCKVGGIKSDLTLMREYSKRLDSELVQKKIVNSIATNSVYNRGTDNTFIEDVSDFLSNINDNTINNLNLSVSDFSMQKKLEEEYYQLKQKKETRLKNRLED